MILGLTGNIGCGKSSLSNILIDNKFDVIDADIISRQIFEDKKLLELVFSNFGEEIKNSDGSLNRKSLGNIVFNDDEKLILLNSLTHPAIKQKIKEKIKEIEISKRDVVIIDGALLVEGGYLEIVNKLIVITCNEEVQIDRIQKRDNCTREVAMSRIKSQMSQEEKVRYGDYIINNSGSIEDLIKESKRLILFIKENWCG